MSTCYRIGKPQSHPKTLAEQSQYRCDVLMELPSVYGEGTDAGLSEFNSRINTDYNSSSYYNTIRGNGMELKRTHIDFHQATKSCLPHRRGNYF